MVLRLFISLFKLIVLLSLGIGIGYLLSNLPIKFEKSDNEQLDVTVQLVEIADDGVFSHARNYTAEHVSFQSNNVVRLKNVTDEYGVQYKNVLLQNIPVIIEQKQP